MWILGILVLLLLIGFKGMIKLLLGIYALYLLAVFCPTLAALIVFGFLIKHYLCL